MTTKLLATTFVTVFLAELGDKTQLATLLLATDVRNSRWTVFCGAALALVTSAALGVLGGSLLRGWLSPRLLSAAGGLAFLVLGAWMLLGAFRGPTGPA